jgi:aminopeptidase N
MKENQNPKAVYLKDYQLPPYLIEKTKLFFYLEEESTRVCSELSLRINPELPKEEVSPEEPPVLELNGVDLELISIKLNGETLSENKFTIEGEVLSFTPEASEIKNEVFQLQIETLIKPHENTALEGLYVSKGMYCTQCEAHGFRRITYYLDRPDVMSEFEVYVEAEQKAYPVLLSNGNLTGEGRLENGRHWVRWHDPFKKPCYLFALVAGDLACVEDQFIRVSGKPVSIKLFVEEHDVGKCDYAIESLKNAMAWDEQVFGREYDLDIYMIVAVSHFNMGAMENKGLNIFNTSCVLASPETTSDLGFERVEGVVAHEYFHNWSGNRVTCRDWFQLSLKEGFTVFRDEEFSSDMGSRNVKRIDDVNILRNFQFKEDAGPMAHSVRPESYIEMNNFYTVTVYNKGAEVVRMQHTLLGKEKFREACDLYFSRFDGQAVTCDDFVACMEEVSGLDFSQFKRWYSQAGTPVVSLSASYNELEKELKLDVSQTCSDTPGHKNKKPFVIPLALALFSESGQKLSFSAKQSMHPGSEALVKESNASECLLVLEKEHESFTLKGVSEKPVLSLLRNFSAPVKIDFEYEEGQLAKLMAFDDDGFNAWDSAQKIYMQELKALVEDYQTCKDLSLSSSLIEALGQLFKKNNEDKALFARMLSLPTLSYLAEQYEAIDVDAVSIAHNFLETEIASRFSNEFLTLYRENMSEGDYKPEAMQVAKRSLKNVALRYLSLLGDDDLTATFLSLAEQQFNKANNMTDEGAALRLLASLQKEEQEDNRQAALNSFYKKWKSEALVIDQWFSVQVIARRDSVLEETKALMVHEDFDINNPNRVRSVLGAFAQNYQYFHQADGSGYAFYAEQIERLNSINPQIAARLLSPLIHWRRYEGERSVLMQKSLERLKALKGLSKDVYEIVDKALSE